MVWSWTDGSSAGTDGGSSATADPLSVRPVSDAAGLSAAASLGAGSSRHFHSLGAVGRVAGGGSVGR